MKFLTSDIYSAQSYEFQTMLHTKFDHSRVGAHLSKL